MSYFIQDAINEYQSLHKFYKFTQPGGDQPGDPGGATQGATGSGPGVTSNGGFGPRPGPDTDFGYWFLSGSGWEWIPLGDPGGDSGGPGGPGGYASGGRTLAEDLAYMEAKYGWDKKLELEVLEAEWDARGKHDVTIADLDYKHKKWLQNIGYHQDMKLADIAQEHKLAFLQEEIGLTTTMKLELMDAQHKNDIEMQDDRQLFEKLMQSDMNDFKADQNGLDRDLQEKLSGLDNKSREAIAAAQIAAQEAMQQAGFGHAEKMQAGQQAFDAEMQKRGFAHDELIQERDLAVRVMINQTQIDSAEKISENKIKADKEMQATQIAFDKEQKEEDRKLRRFEEVQKLRGKDPVRAALMAMGTGDALDQFSGGFGDLGPMEGAEQLSADTESALQGIEGLGRSGETLTLGEQGVSGLASVEKAGTAFVQGPASTRTLVTSAQGVGSGEQAGVSEEDVSARVAAITPKGFDTKRAAGGVGPQLLPMSTNQQYAAEGRGPELSKVANAPRGTGVTTRPAVQPNTSYVVGEGQKGDGTRPEVATTGPNKELLSIEPATTDPAPAQQAPVQQGGDPLVDMFNDPQLTINRGDQPSNTLNPITQDIPVATGQGDPALKTQRINIIRAKKARGEQLTPEEEAELNTELQNQPQQPGVLNSMNNAPMMTGGGLTPTGQTIPDRRRAYMESLPPAQQASIRQTQQRALKDQQNQLVKNLTPDTVNKLMELINNPNRNVNNNLQEQLPQMRDGAGNLVAKSAGLARVV